MRLALVLAAVCTLPALGASFTTQEKKGWHVDEQYGYQIKYPKDWTSIPMQMEESWMIAKFLSDKSQFYTEPGGGRTWEFKPEMHVIAFIDQELKTKVIKEDNKWRIHNPYKDYKDYLKRTYTGGGYYFDEEEEGDYGDIKVTKYSIRVEKLSRQGPKRITTWIFHAPQIDFAVQCEVLEDEFRKSRRDILRTLNSFKLIPRTEGGLPSSTTGPGDIIVETDDSERKLTPEERRNKRVEDNKRAHARAKEAVTSEWDVFETDRFLVLCHTDKKYAKKVVDQAEAIMDWLDETFEYVGPGEYVRKPILRICETEEEERSYHNGRWWLSYAGTGSPEIVIHKDMMGGVVSYNQREVNRMILDLWFHDRDYDLYAAMPRWLEHGLDEVVALARAKGSKMEFRDDGWERDDLREAEREGRLAAPKDLLMMDASEFYQFGGGSSSYEAVMTRLDEVAALVRFLVDDSARKNKKTKAALENYLKQLKAVVTETNKKEKRSTDTFAPKTEEEEDRLYKELQAKWKKAEKNLLEEVFARTFGHWTEDDWADFEKDYRKNLY